MYVPLLHEISLPHAQHIYMMCQDDRIKLGCFTYFRYSFLKVFSHLVFSSLGEKYNYYNSVHFLNIFFSLAQSQQYDQDGVIDIFRQYGDHLYSKGDHDGAINEYIKTIGKLEASYVIRKVSCFL